MAAYIVFTRERVRDPEAMRQYQAKARETLGPSGAKLLAVYGRLEVLEGAEADAVIILEFPTFDEAKAWYESPAYQEAAQHRFRGADFRVMIVEGAG